LSRPVAVVTGGSAGIGHAAARVLAARGFEIVIAARDAERLEQARAALQADTDAPVAAVVCDTTDQGQIDRLIDMVINRCGRIDALVNCAANPSGVTGPIEEIDPGRLLDDLNTKVIGYLRCAKAVVTPMKRQGGGRIVNIGGLTGRASDTLSGLRNVAVSHLTKTLSDELGPFGITVNAVHPGIVRTPHLAELFESEAMRRDCTAAEVEAEFIGRIPTRRILDPAEIGETVAYLLSGAAASVTGESIAVDGGYSRGIYL